MRVDSGWRGKEVKHTDGRMGKIVRASEGFLHIGLFIVDDAGGSAYIQLNSNGPDTGEVGWKWRWREADRDQDEEWGWLGDHNEKPDATLVAQ